MENVVAKTEVFDGQISLGNDVSHLVAIAKEMTVEGEEGRNVAAQWLKSIKQMKEKVTSSWKPFKADAKAIWDRIRKQEKDMLDPLEEADQIIRAKVVDSIRREEEQKRLEAERLKELARKEAEAKLAEAEQASNDGNDAMADMALMEAEVYEQASQTMKAEAVSKVKGVATVKDYEIVSVDKTKVPVSFSGMELRPVDEKAVKRLIKASGGTIEIPGVTYRQILLTRVR